MTIHRRWSGAAALWLAAVGALASLPAQAQNWPTRPVKVIMATAAGSAPDVIARIVTDRLAQLWGQQVLILNRPGAGGLIALQALAAVRARQPHALSAELLVAGGAAGDQSPSCRSTSRTTWSRSASSASSRS